VLGGRSVNVLARHGHVPEHGAMKKAADVALVTESRYVEPSPGNGYVENIFEDDRLVAEALVKRGLSSERVDWSDARVDWAGFRCAVLRTTWDYFHRLVEFESWLDHVQTRTCLINAPRMVRWNLDKHYLQDLQARGVRVVPSVFLERGRRVDLTARLRSLGWPRAVLKPAVSGSARHTHVLEPEHAAGLQPLADRLLREEALILQPFQRDIVERGEVTLVLFEGRFSHAVLKRAKPGDFRVQDDHGGTVHPHAATREEIAFAEAVFAVLDESPLYGRVDLVRDNDGRLAVMELELVEPELWFRMHPPAADAFAAALDERLKR
jgi:glutathione synthase/RimK-type ligase-like ATP-grasp enzyme